MNRSAPRPADSPPDRKSTLFCPSCDHASPVDGDWVAHERASGLEYRCPDCGTPITERETDRGTERDASNRGPGPNPVVRLTTTWVRAAAAWLRPWRRRRARV
jgi:predicted RNA-binding Zn-ribbon protein involved in translation (DUF1610 family)